MLIEFLIVLIGSLFVVLLAYLVIKKSVDLAEHFGVSGTFIGMTVLSIGTSLPEIITHVVGSIHIIKDQSLLQTVSALVIGTNIGSDIFQQNFVLGVVAVIGSVVVLKKNLLSEMGGLIGATLLLLFFGFNGLISKWEGAVLVGGYLLYLIYLKTKGLKGGERAKNHLSRKELLLALFFLGGSFVVISFVANEVLRAAEKLVLILPVSASFFGVIVIGIAAALPELTTSLVALRKNQKGMSAGVLIGSNVTNPMFALGLGAMISTYVVPKVVIWYDLPMKILSSLLILWFLLRKKKLEKKEGLIMIGFFLVYLIVRQMFFPVDF